MNPSDNETIKEMLRQKAYMREMVASCTSCGLCAESCFVYRNTGLREAIPSYKIRRTVGKLFSTNGNINRSGLIEMSRILWGYCALCRQCYCPVGIDLSSILSWGRAICRSQNIDCTTSGVCCDK